MELLEAELLNIRRLPLRTLRHVRDQRMTACPFRRRQRRLCQEVCNRRRRQLDLQMHSIIGPGQAAVFGGTVIKEETRFRRERQPHRTACAGLLLAGHVRSDGGRRTAGTAGNDRNCESEDEESHLRDNLFACHCLPQTCGLTRRQPIVASPVVAVGC